MTRRTLALACLAALSLLAVAALPGAQASTEATEGGIFRVSFQGSSSLQAFDHIDPAAYINRLLDGQHAGGTNLAHFDEAPYNAQMQQASRLRGAARAKAYAELDLRLARDAAPLVPIAVFNEATLVLARVPTRCMLLRPGLVLTTVCLKP